LRRRDLVDLIVLALIWGASFLFIKVGLQDFAPVDVVGIRLFLGAVTMALIVAIGHFSIAGWQRRLPALLMVGVTGTAIPFALISWGELHVSSGLAAILNSTTPFFAAPIAHLWLGTQDRLTAAKVTGILVGFVGVVVLLGNGTAGATGASLLGGIAVLGASLSYGVNIVFVRRHLHDAPALLPPLGQTVMGTLVTAPFAIAALPHHQPQWLPVLSLVGLGVLGTGVAYLFYFRLIRHVGPTRTSMVTYLVPFTAVIYGIVLLHEPMAASVFAGLALILLGIGFTLGMVRIPAVQWRAG
jgi:drug/metabolite transporter (DMT)-like permease